MSIDSSEGLPRLRADVRDAAAIVATPRQLEALELRVAGLSYREIARQLHVSAPTIRERLETIDRHLRAHLFGEELGFDRPWGTPWSGHDWVGPVREHRRAHGWIWEWLEPHPDLTSPGPRNASGRMDNDKVPARRSGRRSKLTAELQKAFVAETLKGTSAKRATAMAGIDETTLYRWLARGSRGIEPYAGFLRSVTAARVERERLERDAHDRWRQRWLDEQDRAREASAAALLARMLK